MTLYLGADIATEMCHIPRPSGQAMMPAGSDNLQHVAMVVGVSISLAFDVSASE